jgi:amino-acid N-acetyltransferase
MSLAPPSPPDGIHLRPAGPGDVAAIHGLLTRYAADQLLLPRSPADILARIANFAVAETVPGGAFVGCVALRDYGTRLFEVRSLAVHPDFLERRIGSALVAFQVDRVRRAGGGRVFALTYHPRLFTRLGFAAVDKSLFPEKIWSDCQACPKRDCCDEEAVLLEAEAAT